MHDAYPSLTQNYSPMLAKKPQRYLLHIVAAIVVRECQQPVNLTRATVWIAGDINKGNETLLFLTSDRLGTATKSIVSGH